MLTDEFEALVSDLSIDTFNLIGNKIELNTNKTTTILTSYIKHNMWTVVLSNDWLFSINLKDDQVMDVVSIIPELVSATVTKLIIDKETNYLEMNYVNNYFNCNKYISFNFTISNI